MCWLYIGILGFIIFIIYDYGQLKGYSIGFRWLFFLGVVLVVIATAGLALFPSHMRYGAVPLLLPFFAVFSIVSAAGLIYSLFFAIPFKATYAGDGRSKVCASGVYALCRHPGVIFFALFYVFYGLTLCDPFVIVCGIIFSLCNLLYVILQDKYFFPKLLEGYDEYKKTVPFIVPTLKSAGQCIRDIKSSTKGAGR